MKSLLRHMRPIQIAVCLMIAGILTLMPPPVNAIYLFKRAFFQPTALCRDGIYSFSKDRSGTCSDHGGVADWK